jgi:hypothetical protein
MQRQEEVIGLLQVDMPPTAIIEKVWAKLNPNPYPYPYSSYPNYNHNPNTNPNLKPNPNPIPNRVSSQSRLNIYYLAN